MYGKKKPKALILIVDGDRAVVTAYRRALERRLRDAFRADDPITVMAQTSPENTLTVLRTPGHEYDAVMVISDGDMPGMQGPRFIAALATLFHDRLKMKILISGSLTEEDQRLAREGAFRAFAKPISTEGLNALFDEFLKLTAA